MIEVIAIDQSMDLRRGVVETFMVLSLGGLDRVRVRVEPEDYKKLDQYLASMAEAPPPPPTHVSEARTTHAPYTADSYEFGGGVMSPVSLPAPAHVPVEDAFEARTGIEDLPAELLVKLREGGYDVHRMDPEEQRGFVRAYLETVEQLASAPHTEPALVPPPLGAVTFQEGGLINRVAPRRTVQRNEAGYPIVERGPMQARPDDEDGANQI